MIHTVSYFDPMVASPSLNVRQPPPSDSPADMSSYAACPLKHATTITIRWQIVVVVACLRGREGQEI
ncbi:hypothetical protein PRUPE_5G097100 [Prunus persica]|uniref:Uncharacterized protein n=1 Tax=Prunus persica TaxID=3760 RepID=A0A251P632_PRUPE|nr:hypothetical protein PRUPE_5G097100 [Prunus persica]